MVFISISNLFNVCYLISQILLKSVIQFFSLISYFIFWMYLFREIQTVLLHFDASIAY